MTMLELVTAAQAGDRTAYGALVARFQDLATGYAFGILQDLGAAEDAAQDAFVEAFHRLDQLRVAQAFPSWLRRIVFKHCDRRTRRRAVEAPVPAPPEGADEALDRARARAWVRAAVEGLPEHERIVVALHYFGESAQADVADFLELPLSTVKKRLYSARRRLEAKRSQDVQTLRPSRNPTFTDRINLFLAIRSGDRGQLEAILDAHPEWLDAPEQWADAEALEGEFPLAHKLTPLVLAAGRGDLALVDSLLARGAAVDGRCGCDAGETPLFAAVAHARPEVVARLLAAGADPNATNDVGHTALHVAEQRGLREIAEALRVAGADPARAADNGRTPDDYRAAKAAAEAATHTPGEARVLTGIKGLDLLAPLYEGAQVRVHAAAETGLMVMMAELAHVFAAQGRSVVWTTRAVHPWQQEELRDWLARSGLADRVRVEPEGFLPEGVAEDAALFVFRVPGHEAEVDTLLPTLRRPRGLTFVIDPWVAVTKAELGPPELKAPYDAQIVTDPELAKAGVYPALDLERTRARRVESDRQSELQARVRAACDDARVRAFLSQPFFTVAAHNGMPGVSVALEDTLSGFAAIIDGNETRPPDALRYRGALV